MLRSHLLAPGDAAIFLQIPMRGDDAGLSFALFVA